jgi:hypothetical protein
MEPAMRSNLTNASKQLELAPRKRLTLERSEFLGFHEPHRLQVTDSGRIRKWLECFIVVYVEEPEVTIRPDNLAADVDRGSDREPLEDLREPCVPATAIIERDHNRARRNLAPVLRVQRGG